MSSANPSRRRRRDPAAARADILAAAGRLLAQNDGALEMAWVAREAGVSQGLAYHHFGSREGLLVAVVEDFYDRMENEVLMAPMAEFAGWEARELHRSERYIAFLLNEPLGCLLVTRLSVTPAVAAEDTPDEEYLRNVPTEDRPLPAGYSPGTESLRGSRR